MVFDSIFMCFFLHIFFLLLDVVSFASVIVSLIMATILLFTWLLH